MEFLPNRPKRLQPKMPELMPATPPTTKPSNSLRYVVILFLFFPLVFLQCQPPNNQEGTTEQNSNTETVTQQEAILDASSGKENAASETGASDTTVPEEAPEPPTEPSPVESVKEQPGESQPPDDTIGPYACPAVQTQSPPPAMKLNPFYKKYVDAGGLPLVGSDKVPDASFAQAYFVIANMLHNKPCIRKALINSGILLGIMAESEVTTDMPEYSDLNKVYPNVDWDKRGRGFGATLVRPLTTGSVENLLQKQSDPWFGELIFLHELAHSYFEFGIESLEGGPQHRQTLNQRYQEAMQAGLWSKTYAATNANEYWAETVQSWFNNNIAKDPPNGIHNNISTRSKLETYDPKMAAYIAQFFDATPWPAYCSTTGGRPWKDPTPKDLSGVSCKFHRFFLADQGCKDLDQRKSQNGGATQSITFVNRNVQSTYKVEWFNAKGERQSYGSLSPRYTRTLSTFDKHAWLITDDQGNCIATYQTSHPLNVISLP